MQAPLTVDHPQGKAWSMGLGGTQTYRPNAGYQAGTPESRSSQQKPTSRLHYGQKTPRQL